MEARDVSVGDEGIGGGRERVEDGVDDIGDEVEASVDGLLAEDGDFLDVGLRHNFERTRGSCSVKVNKGRS